MDELTDLIKNAKAVLDLNDQGAYTVPSNNLYPHQWLWDSCFIAIGISNYDIERAQQEILSLLRGQWSNGMLPNIIFSPVDKNRGLFKDSDLWRSWTNPFSPDDVETSGITQPPLVAEAVIQIGKRLSVPERRTWYRLVFPALLKYHQWIYNDRDPHKEGLALLIHPWESGSDNSPPWISELNTHSKPLWVTFLEKSRLIGLFSVLRRDTKHVPKDERPSSSELLTLYSAQRRLKRKAYDIDKILPHSLFAIEDLTFNCILIKANKHLRDIAKSS